MSAPHALRMSTARTQFSNQPVSFELSPSKKYALVASRPTIVAVHDASAQPVLHSLWRVEDPRYPPKPVHGARDGLFVPAGETIFFPADGSTVSVTPADGSGASYMVSLVELDDEGGRS